MRCIVAGHRGAKNLAPENTLASFAAAMDIGVNELELDLRVSRDRQIVVIHDATVDRTTNGSGPVSERSLQELQALDAGNGAVIPTFRDVLDATGSISLQVEIKDPDAIDLMLEELRARPADMARLAPTSFDETSVRRLAEALPDVDVGLISSEASPQVLDRASDLGARRVLVGYASVDERFVAAAHDRGFRVDLWPIDSPEQVRRLVGLGANGFTTDDPRIVAAAGYRVTPAGLVDIT